jgi:hypothetical protein
MLNRNDSVKKNFNHRWTQINTDEEMSERRSGPDFRRSLNDALYVVLEYHVFYPCPSVVKKSFTAWIRLRRWPKWVQASNAVTLRRATEDLTA